MQKVAILGDIHLGKGMSLGKAIPGTYLNTRIADQFKILDWFLYKCDEQHINNIILTGDVFEEPKPPPFLISLFIDWLKKCQHLNIKVHIIYGNHDFIRVGSQYSSPLDIINYSDLNDIYVYNDVSTIYIEETAFTLIPFKDRKSLECKTNSEAVDILSNLIEYERLMIPLTYKKIAIGHLALEKALFVGDDVEDIGNELIMPLSTFDNYDNVWMGHVHKPQILKNKPYIAHIGSMDVSNFDETDDQKIIVVYDCIEHKFTSMVIPTRRLKNINLEIKDYVEDSTQYIIDQIDKLEIDNCIVKLQINIENQDVHSIKKSKIEKKLHDKGVFHIYGIQEIKKSKIVKKENVKDDVNFNTKIDINSAIKSYADNFVKKELSSKFIETCNKILLTFNQEKK